jgi:hypothetical protein
LLASLLLDQGVVGGQHPALVGRVLVVTDLGQACFDTGLGELALVGLGLCQQPVLPAVLLVQRLHLAGDGVALGFELSDGDRLRGEPAVDHQAGRDQVGVGLGSLS